MCLPRTWISGCLHTSISRLICQLLLPHLMPAFSVSSTRKLTLARRTVGVDCFWVCLLRLVRGTWKQEHIGLTQLDKITTPLLHAAALQISQLHCTGLVCPDERAYGGEANPVCAMGNQGHDTVRTSQHPETFMHNENQIPPKHLSNSGMICG